MHIEAPLPLAKLTGTLCQPVEPRGRARCHVTYIVQRPMWYVPKNCGWFSIENAVRFTVKDERHHHRASAEMRDAFFFTGMAALRTLLVVGFSARLMMASNCASGMLLSCCH
jgi:hypothetical protein